MLWPQREAIKAALQYPGLAGPLFDSLPEECFTHPAYSAIVDALSGAGGCVAGKSGANWVSEVSAGVRDAGPRDEGWPGWSARSRWRRCARPRRRCRATSRVCSRVCRRCGCPVRSRT
ncbi:hypothetical protein ACFSSF_10025 [Dietzia aerolata]|uniref:hypothetical protein n=1 Tax=Dietzia aerolata TaxID=595984 RepID=UPI003639E004